MSLTPSTMLALGTKAPAFRLPDTEGKLISPESVPNAKGYLVVFMCKTTCPIL